MKHCSLCSISFSLPCFTLFVLFHSLCPVLLLLSYSFRSLLRFAPFLFPLFCFFRFALWYPFDTPPLGLYLWIILLSRFTCYRSGYTFPASFFAFYSGNDRCTRRLPAKILFSRLLLFLSADFTAAILWPILSNRHYWFPDPYHRRR